MQSVISGSGGQVDPGTAGLLTTQNQNSRLLRHAAGATRSTEMEMGMGMSQVEMKYLLAVETVFFVVCLSWQCDRRAPLPKYWAVALNFTYSPLLP